MSLKISRAAAIHGTIRPPSDKSLTHRSYLFASIASSDSVVHHPLTGEDCESTLTCLTHLGLRSEKLGPHSLRLVPAKEWVQPNQPLDCGNSGTTMRLLSGLIASRPLTVKLFGDESLSRRPMKRIAAPLALMGATVEGDTPPITVHGGELKGIDYISPVASAQVKSCTLLAGLLAQGTTSVLEPSLSRDHTERMLSAIGIKLEIEGLKSSVEGGQVPTGFEFDVPADISSAAFFMVAAALLNDSQVKFENVGLNPSRTGIIDVFEQSGVPVQFENIRSQMNEPAGDFIVGTAPKLQPFEISGDLVPRLIDEIPVLAVLATQCEGTSVIKDAKELRVKESDRIELVAKHLRAMGANVETFEDGMAITGPTRLVGTRVESNGDHRIAMAFAIAGLIADGTTEIFGAESILTSFPTFESELEKLLII